MSVTLRFWKHGKEGSEEHPDTPTAVQAARMAIETGEFKPVDVRNPWGFVLLTESELEQKVWDGL